MVKIDIEMPTYCYDCPCQNGENGKCQISGNYTDGKRPFDCPLTEEKNGEWRSEIVKRKDWKGNAHSYIQPISCSVCHKPVIEQYPYCPYCGTKMDEKDGER